MKKFFLAAITCFVFTCLLSQSKQGFIDKIKFFESDSLLDVTITAEMGKLVNSKLRPEYLPAAFSCRILDSNISDSIRVIARGNMRRQICYMPPLKLDFRADSSSRLYSLNSLKLVNACRESYDYDQLVLKEYLVYKIYNLITGKSFRVRLLNMQYADKNGKKKTISNHAFLIEDGKEMAKRNGCRELKDVKIHSEKTARNQMTIVTVFQYMIGNTDFGVSVNHNTVLMQAKDDSASLPFVVPYDFDYAGIVDADYAVPSEGLDIKSVRERVYRGYIRTPYELNEVFAIFNEQKENIYSLIKNFALLSARNKNEMISYLDDFYKTISNPKDVKDIFIDNARR